ncbi:hypothetical protein [Vibrio splendidus]|uniref:hypothetical protein n=1 Tax=Vibrio splendidus TaxID=29497 RepID=UPI00080DF5CC|nr:hypothetical protein [Vibrio splendidus]OCH68568.1 hypothetical protein A6D94_05035 [Vibrio splendidus]
MKSVENYIRHRVIEILSFGLSKSSESDWEILAVSISKLVKEPIQETSNDYKVSVLFDYLFLKYHEEKVNIYELKSALSALGVTKISDALPNTLISKSIVEEDRFLKAYIEDAKRAFCV